jgi:hypothetical protein
MKTLNIFIVFVTLTLSLQSFAAIGCRPLVNCPSDPQEPSLSGSGVVIPVETELTVIGYAEVASPTCKQSDLNLAIHIAKNKAIKDAQITLGDDAIQSKEFWFSTDCGQGIYSNSAEGNSWIVQAFAKFKPNK